MQMNLWQVLSSTPSSPRVLPSDNFFKEQEDEEPREAREVTKEITEQMRENRRDEALLSSALSNEFADENLSDSEVMSPSSRHSWDHVNGCGSPFSSSFSRASNSPESSVCREAKKRPSERWAMMASNGNNNNNNNTIIILINTTFPRSSSTLGELLALSEVMTSEIREEEENDKDQDPRGSTSGLKSNMGTRESDHDSSRNLSRSKSVPMSPLAYGGRLNVEVASPALCNGEVPKEILKAKTSKTTFSRRSQGFFSRGTRNLEMRSPANCLSMMNLNWQ